MATVHVIPRNDAIEHDTSNDEPDCVCGPTVLPADDDHGVTGWIIQHHSLDGRERGEAT